MAPDEVVVVEALVEVDVVVCVEVPAADDVLPPLAVVRPTGVTSVADWFQHTHVSQSVVAWPGQAMGSKFTTGLSPNTSLCAMMSKW